MNGSFNKNYLNILPTRNYQRPHFAIEWMLINSLLSDSENSLNECKMVRDKAFSHTNLISGPKLQGNIHGVLINITFYQSWIWGYILEDLSMKGINNLDQA